jgi:hypothetical protein
MKSKPPLDVKRGLGELRYHPFLEFQTSGNPSQPPLNLMNAVEGIET